MLVFWYIESQGNLHSITYHPNIQNVSPLFYKILKLTVKNHVHTHPLWDIQEVDTPLKSPGATSGLLLSI